jgi:uncharacterized protein YceK
MKILLAIAIGVIGCGQVMAAANVTKFLYKERVGAASWSHFDDTGCLLTEVFVMTNELAQGSPSNGIDFQPMSSARARVFDTCTGTDILNTDGIEGPNCPPKFSI